ncbi:hypothetical protein L2E82_29459 [Cichorium intybus]|uniref:Uncharacterized protein n=1 Tax=Cichorium intybus TaxID=13427 RepID=A0ACB9CXW1_CICIN|nr:hypothetical protein L2E82_29459 [Cichorium intybus]
MIASLRSFIFYLPCHKGILFYSILSAIFHRLSLLCLQRISLPLFQLQDALKIMAIPALELPGTVKKLSFSEIACGILLPLPGCQVPNRCLAMERKRHRSSFDLFGFFSNSVFSGFSDKGVGFYKVYSDVFDKIYKMN